MMGTYIVGHYFVEACLLNYQHSNTHSDRVVTRALHSVLRSSVDL